MLIIHLQATQPETKAATKPTANDNAGMLPATSSPFTIFITSNNASPKVNEEELADLSRDIVHVVGRLNEDSFRPLQTAGLQGNSLSYRNSRIEELKEISGNRDLTQGGL